MGIIDFKAAQKWSKVPKNIQEQILKNVFCPKCGVATIVEYSIQDDKLGILLKGKCNKCGNDVARFVENE